MLESITVKNLALIKESEVILRPGLNILSGETGAGKSIILGSIRLALGERASKDIIRHGEEYALIELVFTTDRVEVLDKMRALDIPIESDGSVIITRRIMENRSVAKCNGETISSKALKELASMLISIHGQNDTQVLLDARNYRDIVDDYGDDKLAECKESLSLAYKNYRKLSDEYDNAATSGGSKDKDIALAGFEADEIEAARLVIGEDEELEERYRIMKNSQRIAESLSKVHSAISSDAGASMQIGYAIRELGAALQYDDGLSDIANNLTMVEDVLNDTLRSISGYMDDMEFSEKDFKETENRLDTYNHLKDKYGDSVEKILAYAEERRQFIEKMNDYEAYLEGLLFDLNEAKDKALAISRELTKLRMDAAKGLEDKLLDNLKDLNFGSIQVEIKISSDEEKLGKDGIDEVDFLVSFNMGEPLKSLSQVASGGELSRFMLALKAVNASKESIETLVFDEIDSGISGKTAWNVSQKMAVLGKEHQVIAITHLPQIAAMADTHFLIEKKVTNDSTITDIKKLALDEQVSEIARMLSGGELTENGLSNAKELIENARSCKM